MNYQQFVVAMKDAVAAHLGFGMNLQIHTTLKNNGSERIGLTIGNCQANIFPTIYLEEYYQQYQNGFSIDHIAKSISSLYHSVKLDHSWDVNQIKDFSTLKPSIMYKLIHTEKNRTLLQTMPHLPFLDLAIVFYVLFEFDDSGTATIPITTELLRFWETTTEELYLIASENASTLLPATFQSMRIVVEELLGYPCDSGHALDDIMFVLSNPLRTFGAASILYSNILQQISQKFNENFFVLPSSIHEVIIIPESKSPTKEELLAMVSEINDTQVAQEEFLSNSVYYYDSEMQKLTY